MKVIESEMDSSEIVDNDQCCSAFGTGSEQLRDSCLVSHIEISSNLVYDNFNMCRTRTV